jgi:hypothetical protein
MTAAAAVKAPGGEACSDALLRQSAIGQARTIFAVPRRPPRSYRHKFHNNSYANRTWTPNSGDELPRGRGNDRPALTGRRSRRNLGRHAAVVDAAKIGAGAERLDETRIASVVLRDRAEIDRSGAQMRLTGVIADIASRTPVAISVELGDEETA